MRKVLMMFLCSVSIIASATDYYVSSSGNDSENGLSSSTPWQSISKVNSVFPSLSPGDRILFKRGDLFYGTLKITRSGSLGSPITISAYGSGNNPVISGFTTITGWNSYGNGIYYKAVSCESKPNMVTVNGVNTPIGRWPNEGLLTIDAHTTNTSISDAELSSSTNWSGAEIIIRKNQYIWDRNKITAHSGNTISYTSGSDYSAGDGYGYFIQNDLKTLDRQGEWFYDGSGFYMYFGSNNPESFIVKVSSLEQLAFIENTDFISIESIAFEGANIYALQIKNSDNVTIQNCSIDFTGNTAIFGPYSGTSTNCKILNNSITNSNNKAISLSGDHSSAAVTDNRIINSGIIIGMGESGDGTYSAVEIGGANSTIQYNSIENSGYIAINFSRNNVLVANNLVNTFNLVKNDGGGIYTFVGTGVSYTGQKIIGNIVLNGIGYGDGLPHNEFHSCGIYIDDRVRNVIITNNTISNCNSTGLYLHNAHEIEITENTLYNNGSGRLDIGSQILFVHDNYSPDDPIRNIKMNNNILFARSDPEIIIAFSTTNNDISSFGTADNNGYAKPTNNSYIARTWSAGWNGDATMRSFSDWQSITGQDKNSYISPISLTDVNKIRFEYNASNSNKVVSLDGSYLDVKGTKYPGTITLLPYSSAVLMVDPNPTAPPASPSFVSAAVENAAPSIIELTYNLSLANIVPAAAAFSVQVNSAVRAVNSVSVSGTKVSMTLASPVAYGNTVTISYTAPSSNPLQTPAGGIAASISTQTVTNRVSEPPPPPPPPPTPVYVSSVIENTAPSVVLMTYNLSLANIVPAAAAFSVQVNSATRAVSSVTVSGTNVSLTLASPVAYGNTVTVSYTAPSSNPLQTSAGGIAASISTQTITNRVSAPPPPPATPVYVSSVIENTAPSVVVMTYNLSLANIVPATAAFSVQVNSAVRAVNSVSVSGTKVSMTLASPVAYGNTVTVSYTAPSSNQLQTSVGGIAASISAQSVTNKVSAPPPPPPPPAPVYVGSAIENTAPSVINLTYNLTLTSITPAASAFSVLVNSVARAVTSVTVSGTKVVLTLASPVAYGNLVTVAYTRPSVNPLQTASGGQAASITGQPVSNKVNAVVVTPPVIVPPPVVNNPPAVVINYQPVAYSGFESVMDASGSYDINKDKLTFSWTIPSNMPVSSTTGAIIKFLSPVVEVSKKVEFALNVSDGKTTESKKVQIEILPYKPELKSAEIVKVEASTFQTPYYPHNIIDGDIGTIWSANGDQQWIILELKEPFNIQHLKLAFQPGQTREAYFDILGSEDKEVWDPILTKSKTCAFSGNLQVFDFPPSKTGKEFRFIKLVGHGNAADMWNFISEFRIFGHNLRNTPDYEKQIVKIFPNPARAFTNILVEEGSFIPDFIKIVTLAGKTVFQDKVAPGIRQFQIPLNFKQGIYIVQMGTEPITMFSQKLVVTY